MAVPFYSKSCLMTTLLFCILMRHLLTILGGCPLTLPVANPPCTPITPLQIGQNSYPVGTQLRCCASTTAVVPGSCAGAAQTSTCTASVIPNAPAAWNPAVVTCSAAGKFKLLNQMVIWACNSHLKKLQCDNNYFKN